MAEQITMSLEYSHAVARDFIKINAFAEQTAANTVTSAAAATELAH